jgi:hypothetical protein
VTDLLRSKLLELREELRKLGELPFVTLVDEAIELHDTSAGRVVPTRPLVSPETVWTADGPIHLSARGEIPSVTRWVPGPDGGWESSVEKFDTEDEASRRFEMLRSRDT